MDNLFNPDRVFDSITYKKGFSYFLYNNVQSCEVLDDKIVAKVYGTRVYNVIITYRPDGTITNMLCSCPFAQKSYRCKHMAATIIYANQNGLIKESESKISEVTIIRDRSEFKKDDIINLSSRNTLYSEGGISHREVLFSCINREQKKKYEMVFLLKDDHKNGIIVEPCIRYIKKDGTYGAVYRFSSSKLDEINFSSESELLLFRRFYSFSSGSVSPLEDRDGNIIDFFMRHNINRFFVDRYYSGRDEYELVRFRRIEKIKLGFYVNYHRYGDITFTPMFYFEEGGICGYVDRGDRHRDGKPHDYFTMLFNGEKIFFVCSDGMLFYKEITATSYEAIKYILSANLDSLGKIDGIKSYIERHNIKDVEIMDIPLKVRIVYPVPKPIVVIRDSIFGSELRIHLWFEYDRDIIFQYDSDDDLVEATSRRSKNETVVISRNKEYEKKVLEYLEILLRKNLSRWENYMELKMSKRDFLVKYGLKLIEEGFSINLERSNRRISSSRGKVKLSIKSDIDWFDIDVEYEEEGETKKLLIEDINSGLARVGNEYVILSKHDISKIESLLKLGMDNNGKIKASKYDFALIDQLFSLSREASNNEEIVNIKNIYDRLKDFSNIEEYPLPSAFKGTLRNYQIAGYMWLHFLEKYSLNGCLADDMGLGKTIQTLAFLQRLKEENRIGTNVIVAPVNTLRNWANEIQRFVPDINFYIHHGQNRNLSADNIKDFEVIITSYATLRNDIELFKDFEFNYVILDEAQLIKNHNALISRAVRILKARHKLSLTGTPIENNTLELWTHMDFLNPGLLGNITDFRRRFARPIEIDKDENAREILKKKVFPFILRRKKVDVLKDLPPKNEIVLYCEMEVDQRRLYEEWRQYYKGILNSKIDKDGVAGSAIDILSALTKLRQIALFPELINKKYSNISSCKFELMKETVSELLEEGHRIIIFSQFVGALSIIKDYIAKEGLNYCYIDGSVTSTKRQKEIDKFQSKDGVDIFLISLRAGGLGINLTSADYVILYDPWWNPAVESQAIDRVHRIGQKESVFAYKMIVRDSVEEKILALQEKKRRLVEDIVTTESTFFKSLNKDDIMALLE